MLKEPRWGEIPSKALIITYFLFRSGKFNFCRQKKLILHEHSSRCITFDL